MMAAHPARVDSVHAVESPSRPHLDRERRCSQHFAPCRHAWLSAHHRDCASLALHRCSWVHPRRHRLHRYAIRYRAVAAHCPTSPVDFLQAWNTWVHYATFHLPPEPNGFYGYNALQQIAYFTVVLVRSARDCHRDSDVSGGGQPVSVVRANIRWRQSARSIHFSPCSASLHFWWCT